MAGNDRYCMIMGEHPLWALSVMQWRGMGEALKSEEAAVQWMAQNGHAITLSPPPKY